MAKSHFVSAGGGAVGDLAGVNSHFCVCTTFVVPVASHVDVKRWVLLDEVGICSLRVDTRMDLPFSLEALVGANGFHCHGTHLSFVQLAIARHLS